MVVVLYDWVGLAYPFGLVVMLDSLPYRNSWNYRKKQGRAYSAIVNGSKFALSHNQKLYFLTLTSSPNSGDIHRNFNKLVRRIRKRYGLFEYVYIRTREGLGVLHILFKVKKRLEIDWLRQEWVKMHNAPQMKLLEAYGGAKRLSNYLAGYLSKNPLERLAYSTLWLFPKWRMKFCAYIRLNGFIEGINAFESFLINYDTRSLYTQKYMRQLTLDVLYDI